jgi:acyl-CoA thioesterase-2
VPDLWSDLLSCLELAPDPARNHDDTDVAVFEGRNQQLEYHRVFGGQLLGQFIQIASLTCPDKAVKSQHAVFAKEGRADEPIRYEATRHHEGRSFATVTITARQSRGVVATSSISMHVAEDGPEHQVPVEVPAVLGPEDEVPLDLIPWQTRATVGFCCASTVRCWHSAAASAAAMSSPRAAHWSPRTPKKPCCASRVEKCPFKQIHCRPT